MLTFAKRLALYLLLMRRFTLIIFLFVLMTGSAFSEEHRYASIVVDADTLEIIHARQIDEKRFPASLTKVMTLYLTFDALNEGRLKLKEQVSVSQHAAQTPPSKLGLKAGQKISVEDLIQALAVKSANDAAVVLAERLAGSEDAFAIRMTAKAKSLGMMRTTFKNPHGLPHPEQKSSARDMAKLASNILKNHRRYYHYFGQTHFSYKGTKYKNTNKLLHWLDGVDGFKTGYTRASGYNLIISAHREGRRLIAVVLGGASKESRNQHMEDLVKRGFDSMGVAPVTSLPPVTIVQNVIPKLKPAQNAVTQAVRLRGRDNKIVTVTAEESPVKFAKSSNAKNWGIQIGAFRNKKSAQNQIDAAARLVELQTGTVEPLKRNGKTLYRARFNNLSITNAQAACKALADLPAGCLIVVSN